MKQERHIIYAFITMLLFSSCSLMLGKTAPEEQRTYTRIIEVPNRTKNSLYVGVNSWFVSTFDHAGSVIEFTDKEAGRIIGKYFFATSQGIEQFAVRQTISVDVKDNKVRFIITDPYYKWIGDTFNGQEDDYATFEPLVTEDGLEIARREWENLADSLEDYLRRDTSW